jgi:hypothetical protein
MPLQKLQFRPGLNREGTDYANEGGWYDGDKIRFRSGFPEKIGGWTQLTPSTFLGTCRSLWGWTSLSKTSFLGVGTTVKYYIQQGGAYSDITPIYHTSSLTNPFKTAFTTLNGGISATATSLTLTSATNFTGQGVILIDSEQISYTSKSGSDLLGLVRGFNGTTAAAHLTGADVGSYMLTVTDATLSPNVGDYILIQAASAVGGITVSSPSTPTEYTVQEVLSSTTYSIRAATQATSQATGGGSTTIQYEYPVGLNFSVVGGGWGAGPWGFGGWGTPYSSTTSTELRLWTNDNYGQELYIANRGGPIYFWVPSGGTYPDGTPGALTVRAKSLELQSTAAGYSGNFVPNSTNQVISSAIQRFIIAFGANGYDPLNADTTFNPMLVRWSDQENPYQWVPAVTNQSGEYELANGSFIMGARATRQEILVWTDAAIYSMQYLGPPYVWGFQILMDNISTISPNCMITVNNVTYWMGLEKFYMYSGRVETLPCSIRQFIFEDLNQGQAYQIFAGANEAYNEVWWFYVSNSLGGNTVNRYVIYNYLDRVWYYGTMARSAWLDAGINQFPIAADYNNRLLQHESAVDDVASGVPVPISAYVQSSDFDIGDGHNFGFVWRILPDVNFNGSNIDNPQVTMTVKPRVNSGTAYGTSNSPRVVSADNYGTTSVYNVQQFTGQVYTRLRGRQMAFRIESTTLGVSWQLGSPRIDIRPDGRR